MKTILIIAFISLTIIYSALGFAQDPALRTINDLVSNPAKDLIKRNYDQQKQKAGIVSSEISFQNKLDLAKSAEEFIKSVTDNNLYSCLDQWGRPLPQDHPALQIVAFAQLARDYQIPAILPSLIKYFPMRLDGRIMNDIRQNMHVIINQDVTAAQYQQVIIMQYPIVEALLSLGVFSVEPLINQLKIEISDYESADPKKKGHISRVCTLVSILGELKKREKMSKEQQSLVEKTIEALPKDERIYEAVSSIWSLPVPFGYEMQVDFGLRHPKMEQHIMDAVKKVNDDLK